MTTAAPPRRPVAPPAASAPGSRPVASLPVVVALLTALLGVVAGGFLLAPQRPAEDSAAVGFARDMSVHHAQAVRMAETIRDRTQDPEIRSFAQDVALTQQAQIGIMSAWLQGWGYTSSSRGPRMAWMGAPVDGPMPGMATSAEVQELGTLPIAQAEDRFLAMMVAHHSGGVDMAEAGVALAGRPEVVALGASIAKAQAAEVEYLQSARAQRGLPPAPAAAAMGHGMAAGHEGSMSATPREVLLWTIVALGGLAALWLLVDSLVRRAGAPQTRVDGAAVLLVAAAMVSVVVHLVLTPSHAQESAAYGVFFVLGALLLTVGAATALAGRPLPGVPVAAATALVLVLTYVLFRLVPAPGADAAEGVDGWGVVAVLAELVVIGVAGWQALERRRAPLPV